MNAWACVRDAARPRSVEQHVEPLLHETVDPPGTGERLARLEADQVLPGLERVRRAGHRLDGEAPPRDVRQRVAREELYVLPRRIRPDGDIVDLHAPRSVHAARLVELLRSEELAVDDEVVDATGRRRDVRMVADAERARTVAGVLSRCLDRQAVRIEPVLDLQLQRERVTGLRVEDVLHDDARRLTLDGVPVLPADEPVDRVARIGLGQREPVVLAVERVLPAAIRFGHGASTWPRPDLHRSSIGVAVEDLTLRDRVRAQAATDLDDRRPLGTEAQVVLLARRRDHAVRTARPSTISRRTDVSASIAVSRVARPVGRLVGEAARTVDAVHDDVAVAVEDVVDDLEEQPELVGERAPRCLLRLRHLRDPEREPDRRLEQAAGLQLVQRHLVGRRARDVEVLAADHPERRLRELARDVRRRRTTSRAGTPPRAARRRRGSRSPRRTVSTSSGCPRRSSSSSSAGRSSCTSENVCTSSSAHAGRERVPRLAPAASAVARQITGRTRLPPTVIE